SERDDTPAPSVALINQTLARSLWPNENPLGKRLTWKEGPDTKFTAEVIGMTRDIKGRDLFARADAMLYLPLLQYYQPRTVLHLRAGVAPEKLTSALRQTVSALDRHLPLNDIKPLNEHLRATLTPQRLLASLITSFGLLALLLAGVGLYGLLAYTVAQRAPEIGLRMALGAGRRDVLALVIKQGFKLAVIGVLIGLGGALAVTRLLKTLLYGVSPTDPLTFAIIPALLLLVALLACWIPARRATKVDPLIVLCCE
ncbi:MAG: FtsX-like permease family protein, partial [Acidobacteria bacterium]|nr:FtsX-like permease family protein [Acidobacteriota bacterium]